MASTIWNSLVPFILFELPVCSSSIVIENLGLLSSGASTPSLLTVVICSNSAFRFTLFATIPLFLNILFQIISHQLPFSYHNIIVSLGTLPNLCIQSYIDQVQKMGNQVLIDSEAVSIADILNINIQALGSSWNYSNSNKTPILMRAWRITQGKDEINEEMIDFITEKNVGIGFSRDEAYIVLTIVDLKCQMNSVDKIPFYTKMFLDSLNNVLDWSKNNFYRRKYDNYAVETCLLKGKRLASTNLLKSLSTYFKLQYKIKQVEQKFLQALFQGAVLSNSKLLRRELKVLSEHKVQCPLEETENFYSKVEHFPVLKQMFGNQKRRRFDQLPIEEGINYWYLFNQERVQEPFELDITQIKAENPIDFSDFQNQLEIGMGENPIVSPQLGDMSLSLLNEFKPVIKYQLPNANPFSGQTLSEKKFYMLCKEKVNGVDVVIWEGREWSKDQEAMGEFIEKVISQNYGNWPDNKIFMHERGYDLN